MQESRAVSDSKGTETALAGDPEILKQFRGYPALDKMGRKCHIVTKSGQVANKETDMTGLMSLLTTNAVSLAPAPRIRPDQLQELNSHGYSEAEIFDLVIPKRTLARRRAGNELLTVEETDKALRLKRIAVHAERVFGDPAKAHRWLRKPKRLLQGETPLAFLASEEGARKVEEMLHRIDHGMAA
jgi:putative toxin-antitoxin system antitoxin component (TIGR02293 family)